MKIIEEIAIDGEEGASAKDTIYFQLYECCLYLKLCAEEIPEFYCSLVPDAKTSNKNFILLSCIRLEELDRGLNYHPSKVYLRMYCVAPFTMTLTTGISCQIPKKVWRNCIGG